MFPEFYICRKNGPVFMQWLSKEESPSVLALSCVLNLGFIRFQNRWAVCVCVNFVSHLNYFQELDLNEIIMTQQVGEWKRFVTKKIDLDYGFEILLPLNIRNKKWKSLTICMPMNDHWNLFIEAQAALLLRFTLLSLFGSTYFNYFINSNI